MNFVKYSIVSLLNGKVTNYSGHAVYAAMMVADFMKNENHSDYEIIKMTQDGSRKFDIPDDYNSKDIVKKCLLC